MSDELILPIPLIPPEILEAVNTKTLAVFVGAGVSRVMGCMGWDELSRRLVKRCSLIKRPTDGLPYLNFRGTVCIFVGSINRDRLLFTDFRKSPKRNFFSANYLLFYPGNTKIRVSVDLVN